MKKAISKIHGKNTWERDLIYNLPPGQTNWIEFLRRQKQRPTTPVGINIDVMH